MRSCCSILTSKLIALPYRIRDHCDAGERRYGQWVIFALVMSFIPGVDIFAHVGGLAGGGVTFLILGTPRARLMLKEPVIRYAAFACLGLTALSLGRLVLAVLRTPS